MFGVGLNTTLKKISAGNQQATRELADANRIAGEQISEGLNNIAESNNNIADSNRNITIPLSEWDKIQKTIKELKSEISDIKEYLPRIMSSYGYIAKKTGSELSEEDLLGIIECIIEGGSCNYAGLVELLSYKKNGNIREQFDFLSDDMINKLGRFYIHKIDGVFPGEIFNLTDLIGKRI